MKHIFDDVRKLPGIRYFRAFQRLSFTSVEGVEASVEVGVKDTRGVESTKVGGILEKRYIDEISWRLGLSRISNEIFFYIFIEVFNNRIIVGF